MILKVNELIQCLQDEKELYIKINELSLLKKEAIIKADIGEIEKIVDSEKLLLEKITLVETKRINVAEQISQHLQINDNQVFTVTEIIKRIDNPKLKARLLSIFNELSIIINRQKDLNKINQSLLGENLNYIKFMMDTIIFGNNDLTYGYEGNGSNLKQKVNIFDQRV